MIVLIYLFISGFGSLEELELETREYLCVGYLIHFTSLLPIICLPLMHCLLKKVKFVYFLVF